MNVQYLLRIITSPIKTIYMITTVYYIIIHYLFISSLQLWMPTGRVIAVNKLVNNISAKNDITVCYKPFI